jgi:hypothetical protein
VKQHEGHLTLASFLSVANHHTGFTTSAAARGLGDTQSGGKEGGEHLGSLLLSLNLATGWHGGSTEGETGKASATNQYTNLPRKV